MYNQLSLESNKKEPQLHKGFEVHARGIRVCNDGCLQDELTSTTSCICIVCWTWRCFMEFESRPWWLTSFWMSNYWSRLSTPTPFCFWCQQNVLDLSLWIFILETFHHSPFSTVHFPIQSYAIWCCVPHAISRLFFHPLACRQHPTRAAKKTGGNFLQGLKPDRLKSGQENEHMCEHRPDNCASRGDLRWLWNFPAGKFWVQASCKATAKDVWPCWCNKHRISLLACQHHSILCPTCWVNDSHDSILAFRRNTHLYLEDPLLRFNLSPLWTF